jgi:hypothetical protein
VKIKIEAVLHRGAVDFGDETAGFGERIAVEADALADGDQLVRRLALVCTAAAANMQPELARERREAALQRADDAGGDARGMPIHPHHRAERLEPEGVGKAREELVAAVMEDDRLGDDRAELCHALRQPGGNATVVKRQIGASGATGHGFS